MPSSPSTPDSIPTIYVAGKVQQQILRCLLSEVPIANAQFPATLAFPLALPAQADPSSASLPPGPASLFDPSFASAPSGPAPAPAPDPSPSDPAPDPASSLDPSLTPAPLPSDLPQPAGPSPFLRSIGTCTKDTLFVELSLSNLGIVSLTRSLPLMRSMLARQANVNFREPATGRTPLHWVMLSRLNVQVGEENLQCFEPFFRGACLLLAHHADETILDREGKTYVDYLSASDRAVWDSLRQAMSSQLKQSSYFVDTVLNG